MIYWNLFSGISLIFFLFWWEQLCTPYTHCLAMWWAPDQVQTIFSLLDRVFNLTCTMYKQIHEGLLCRVPREDAHALGGCRCFHWSLVLCKDLISLFPSLISIRKSISFEHFPINWPLFHFNDLHIWYYAFFISSISGFLNGWHKIHRGQILATAVTLSSCPVTAAEEKKIIYIKTRIYTEQICFCFPDFAT